MDPIQHYYSGQDEEYRRQAEDKALARQEEAQNTLRQDLLNRLEADAEVDAKFTEFSYGRHDMDWMLDILVSWGYLSSEIVGE